MKTITTVLEDFKSKLWGGYVRIPETIVDALIEGIDKRVICTFNGKKEIRASFMKTADFWFILVNKEIQKKLTLSFGDKVTISLIKDTSEYGMEMPEELQVLLDQDIEGNDFFHALTPGKQRSLIYIVNKVKNTNSRLAKALAIVHHLKEVNGKLDFKRLNETIKEYNNSFR